MEIGSRVDVSVLPGPDGWVVSPREGSGVEVDSGVPASVLPGPDGWAVAPRVASGVEFDSGVSASVLPGPNWSAFFWAPLCAGDLFSWLSNREPLGPPQGDPRRET